MRWLRVPEANYDIITTVIMPVNYAGLASYGGWPRLRMTDSLGKQITAVRGHPRLWLVISDLPNAKSTATLSQSCV